MILTATVNVVVNTETMTTESEITHLPPEVDELTMVALIASHLTQRAAILREQGADLTRTNNQITVLFGEDEETD